MHRWKAIKSDPPVREGTVNLDNRQLQIECEIRDLFLDVGPAQRVAAILERDLSPSHQIQSRAIGRRSVLSSHGVRPFRLLGPIA